jgi:putative addiction module killer protein
VSKKLDVLRTDEFDSWLDEQQPKLRTLVLARLDLVSIGHFGNHKRFEGLIELKWLNGTRVYTFMWGTAVVVALYGGNKNGQSRDIKKAKKIRDEVLEGTRTLHK